MHELKTTRPFQERFLDGYDRSQLGEEVKKVKRRFPRIKKKYATWALGASLALGGLGFPTLVNKQQVASSSSQDTYNTAESLPDRNSAETAEPSAVTPLDQQIAGDLKTAKSIADQVAGGVAAAAKGVGDVVEGPLKTVVEAPLRVADVAERVKEHFFRTEVPFGSIIYEEAKKNDLPPELVAAVVHTESKFVPTARSHRGAVGLMQLIPKTGRWMGARDLTNPAQNIGAGARYLRYLSDRFNGDEEKTIAAYNAGEGSVRRFRGVPPFQETRHYLSNVRSFQRDLGERLVGHTADLSIQESNAR